jgi:hypothetical protein
MAMTMMNNLDPVCVIIHDHAPRNYYMNMPLVLHYGDIYETVHYYCSNEMFETLKMIYKGVEAVDVIMLESEDVLKVFNVLQKKYGRSPRAMQCFDNYDLMRKDSYRGLRSGKKPGHVDSAIHNLAPIPDLETLCGMYGLDGINYHRTLSIERNLTKELFFFKQLIKYVNFGYTLVSDDRFKKLNKETVTIINPLKLFPRNKNMFNIMTLIDNASQIFIRNDKLGMFLYFMCTTQNFKKRRVVFFYDDINECDNFESKNVPMWKFVKRGV